jgi:hypothetical protein
LVTNIGDLDGQVQDLLRRQGLTLDAVLERAAVQELHDDEPTALVVRNLVNGANTGMVQGRSGAGLAPETLQRLGILGQVIGKKFQGHKASEHSVFRLIHHTHAATT